MDRKIIDPGRTGLGGGHAVCDGKDHWWVVPEFEKYGCAKETHIGPCHCDVPLEGISSEALRAKERELKAQKAQ